MTDPRTPSDIGYPINPNPKPVGSPMREFPTYHSTREVGEVCGVPTDPRTPSPEAMEPSAYFVRFGEIRRRADDALVMDFHDGRSEGVCQQCRINVVKELNTLRAQVEALKICKHCGHPVK